MTRDPRVDVVIAATESARSASRCAESVGRAARVVIAHDPLRVDPSRLPRWACRIPGEPGADAHRLRRLGFAATEADVVAFTEDSCLLDAGWARAWASAFADPSLLAATGPVALAPGATVVDRAVFLCEYSPFLAPNDEDASRLAGNNFAARRSLIRESSPVGRRAEPALREIRSTGEGSIHEAAILSAARTLGGRVATVPGAVAVHVRSYRAAEAIRDRWRFGRQYGGWCAATRPRGERWVRVTLGPGMLASQVARLVGTLARKRRLDRRFIASMPAAVGLLSAWTAGEWVGWALGEMPTASGPSDEAGARPRGPAPGRGGSARPRHRVDRARD